MTIHPDGYREFTEYGRPLEVVPMMKTTMLIEVVAVQTPENIRLIQASKDIIAEAARKAIRETIERLLRGGPTIDGVASETSLDASEKRLQITLEVPSDGQPE